MSCRASITSQTYQSSLIILAVDLSIRHRGRDPATPPKHLCARQLSIGRWGDLRHDELTALVENNEMSAGSDQRAPPDVLAPFHFAARSVETTQLAFANVPIDAKDKASHEDGAAKLAAHIPVPPDLSRLFRTHLHQSAASVVARGNEDHVA